MAHLPEQMTAMTAAIWITSSFISDYCLLRTKVSYKTTQIHVKITVCSWCEWQ